jgi:hypothetical protein
VVTLEQVGSDVVATGSGPIDLTGLTFLARDSASAFINPSIATITTGPASFVPVDVYVGTFSGPTNFGSGGQTLATSGSGNLVEIASLFSPTDLLGVPAGYVSDTPLSDISTYSGQTFSSLGVTPGIYEWTWGPGANQNFTLDIVAAAVPEPSSLSLLAPPLGFVLLLAARRRRAMRSA